MRKYLREYYVYIMTNRSYTVLYIGVTNDLERRVLEHKSGLTSGFARRYRVQSLIYYETALGPMAAIEREKQIKGWIPARKIALIERMNPSWHDLSAGWFAPPSPPDPSLRSA